jgi:hypothetical protein
MIPLAQALARIRAARELQAILEEAAAVRQALRARGGLAIAVGEEDAVAHAGASGLERGGAPVTLLLEEIAGDRRPARLGGVLPERLGLAPGAPIAEALVVPWSAPAPGPRGWLCAIDPGRGDPAAELAAAGALAAHLELAYAHAVLALRSRATTSSTGRWSSSCPR